MEAHILQFFSMLGNGGAENRMMDVYRCINTHIVQFDFAVVHDGKDYFEDEVANRGAQKYVLPDPSKGLIKNYWSLVKFFKLHREFQAVHAHVAWYNGIVLLAAKHAGIKIRIAHARDSAMPGRSLKQKLMCGIGQLLIGISATQKIAISEEAAENIFGRYVVRNNDYLFVPNAIDQKKYSYVNGEERKQLRESLGIPNNKKAYVTIANIRKQKNHEFLLDIVAEMKKLDDNFILYLIGGDSIADEGLREHLEEKISRIGIEDNVVFMGRRGDVPHILCAFDGMIFPSLYEGLGGVVLEAQLVGVPCVVSTAVPKVVDVGIDMVEYVPLNKSPKVWAEIICDKFTSYSWDRDSCLNAFRDKGYIIEETARKYLREYGLDEKSIRLALDASEKI